MIRQIWLYAKWVLGAASVIAVLAITTSAYGKCSGKCTLFSNNPGSIDTSRCSFSGGCSGTCTYTQGRHEECPAAPSRATADCKGTTTLDVDVREFLDATCIPAARGCGCDTTSGRPGRLVREPHQVCRGC